MKTTPKALPVAIATATIALLLCNSQPPATTAEPQREGPWTMERTAEGKLILAADITLHPQAEPKPALRHRLIPDGFDQIEGNSALFYLKAMGFFEQGSALQAIREFWQKSRELADQKGVPYGDLPPYSWLDMQPEQLPIAEVKEYLSYHSFQPPLLADAAQRSQFSLDRNLRQSDNPLGTLLPEIQSMRELARVQSLRFRIAIAEHRTADAVVIMQQQFAMARHLGSDEFYISNLVGAAAMGIALQDAIFLLKESDAPNLYWAFATLPRPVIGMDRGLTTERHLLTMQLKALEEVNETVRPASYWQDFIDRILPQLQSLELFEGKWLGKDPESARIALVTSLAAAYPGAKRYLLEECHIDRAKVDAFPTAQTVFLAMKRFNEQNVDEHYKWVSLPYEQALAHPDFNGLTESIKIKTRRIGWAGVPVEECLAHVQGIRGAQMRVQQQIALLQTIEAIRMFGAANAGKLPMTLAELPFPAPNDPTTGKPLTYAVDGDQATLSGEPLPYLQYRFKLKFAK